MENQEGRQPLRLPSVFEFNHNPYFENVSYENDNPEQDITRNCENPHFHYREYLERMNFYGSFNQKYNGDCWHQDYGTEGNCSNIQNFDYSDNENSERMTYKECYEGSQEKNQETNDQDLKLQSDGKSCDLIINDYGKALLFIKY